MKNAIVPTQKSSVFAKVRQLSAFHWVLISQLFVVLPHASHLPNWLVVYALVIIISQFGFVRRFLPEAWFQPRVLRFIQYTGFLASLFGLYLTYQTAVGLDVAIAFLLLCATSKLLELYTRRDAYVVLTLSMFVLAGLFLVEQDLATALIVAIGMIVTLLAMISMNDDGMGRYRTLGLLFLQAIPFTIVIFLFFPRLPPLWSVQLSGQNKATTGISDSMSPGDFANLSQSTELAFRVEFQGDIPRRSEMYWRALVFDNFDGVTWRASEKNMNVWHPRIPHKPNWLTESLSHNPQAINAKHSYKVILEKTGQSWLFGLDYPLSEQRGIGLTSDFTLRYWTDIHQQLTYNVYQLKNTPIGLTLSDKEKQQNLQLPATGNEQSRQFAKQLYDKVGKDPIAFASHLEQWINSQQFRYTLSPPRLQQNRIDEFLFGSRAGFCEHYSSSFTFLMRSVGIPARIVTGYQGGELGRDGKSWEVRQMDAHAWSEIWVEGHGWIRIDPTAFVSPDRVEQGMNNLTQSTGAMMFGDGIMGELLYQQFQFIQHTRRLFDQASYYWQRNIVGFDQENQRSSLLKWFNIQSVYQQIVYLFVGSTVLITLLALWLWYKRRQIWDKHDLLMINLSKRLAKHNPTLARELDEGVLNWLERIKPFANNPAQIDSVKQFYRQARYGKVADTHYTKLKQLSREIRIKD